MKAFLLFLALFTCAGVAADTNQDAFNAGASFGKGSSSQGTSALKKPGTVQENIPGFTVSPPETGYYNGVSGGDGGLNNKGQQALQNSDAGQAIISAGTKNPAPVIDPNAPFITAGKAAESGSDRVLDGTGNQCTDTTVSKSTFEKYTCDHDEYVTQTCARTGSLVPGEKIIVEATPFVMDASMAESATDADNHWVRFNFTVPESMNVTSVTAEYLTPGQPGTDPLYLVRVQFRLFGTEFTPVRNSSITTGMTAALTKGQKVSLDVIQYLGNVVIGNCIHASSPCGLVSSGKMVARVTLHGRTETVKPEISWQETCGFAKQNAVSLVDSVCTEPGGDRTITIDGKNYTQGSSCWQYNDTYVTSSGSEGTCGELKKNSSCTRLTQTCTSSASEYCLHREETWECQKTWSSTGQVCGGQYFCRTGDCSDTEGAGDSGFDTAVAKLAGLASAAADVTNDQINVRAFTGRAMSCRKAFAGFSNCCKDSGWGQDAGLSACNDDELALGKAKAKKITVPVGDRCDHQVMGVCVQKSQVYCVFDGKLARIIQEQGRRDQLGIGFGSGDTPDCGGITVPQLQGINFDLINFADFYTDLINNQKIPDSGVMVQQIKDRIAAQVQQQQGSGGAK